jgi:hypothetical protein
MSNLLKNKVFVHACFKKKVSLSGGPEGLFNNTDRWDTLASKERWL